MLRDPVAVYNPATNLEAALVCEMLLAGVIEAHVVEDESRAGAWMLGLLPGIHKPQVWIERSDVERARPLLEEFDRREAKKLESEIELLSIKAGCEECGKPTLYPESRRGAIETCRYCGAYVDVEEDGGSDEIRLRPA